MDLIKQNRPRRIATILLVVHMLLLLLPFLIFYQTSYQLVSPLIPESVLYDIVNPYMITGGVLVLLAIASFILYSLHRYKVCIVLSASAILASQILPGALAGLK